MQRNIYSTAGCVYSIAYHLVWCPKYRKKVLVGDVERRIKELITDRCAERKWEIGNLEVMPDHVHLFVRVGPTDSVAHIVSQLKGYTAHILRDEFPHLRTRIPSLWSRSYYAGSVGHISEDTVLRYIAEQKTKQ